MLEYVRRALCVSSLTFTRYPDVLIGELEALPPFLNNLAVVQRLATATSAQEILLLTTLLRRRWDDALHPWFPAGADAFRAALHVSNAVVTGSVVLGFLLGGVSSDWVYGDMDIVVAAADQDSAQLSPVQVSARAGVRVSSTHGRIDSGRFPSRKWLRLAPRIFFLPAIQWDHVCTARWNQESLQVPKRPSRS